MDDNRIFAWNNYDDNPLDAIGVNTIHTQKEATYAPSAEGELVTDAFDTFMSNGDNYAYPQVSGVAGEEAMVLVFGKGMVEVGNSDEKIEITITPKEGVATGVYVEHADHYVVINGDLKKGDFLSSITIYTLEKGIISAEDAIILDNDDNEVTSRYDITYGTIVQ